MNEFEQSLEQYFTKEQLSRIRSVTVGIAGAGGLGSNCAMALVRSGFQRIRIADFDLVECRNLNRQFYFMEQVGKSKVEMLKENLLRINPNLMMESLQFKLDKGNITNFFEECDVIVEAFDRPDCKQMIVTSFLKSDKFLVAASGLAGWGNSDRIQVHPIRTNFYLVGDLKTGIGSDTPPLAPCVLIAAAKQADLILSYALGTLRKEDEE